MAIASILFLATFIEGFVQYLFSKDGVAQPYLKYIALVFGVVLAVAYKVDIPSMLGLVTDYGIVNYILSGVIIGRGSNYVNDVVSAVRSTISK